MATRWIQPDPAELIVLSILRDEQAYGYAISKQVAARSEDQMRLPPGLLYPLLARMEQQGLIASTWEEVRSERRETDAQGRRRKWYRLTPKGQRRLEQRIEAHRAYQSLLERFIPREGEATREA